MKSLFRLTTLALATTSMLMGLEGSLDLYGVKPLPLPADASTPTLAKTKLRYRAPQLPKRGILLQTQGAASRGELETSAFVTLLAPHGHIGRTTSTHPSFFWYVSSIPSAPLEFTLRDSESKQPVLVKQLQVRRSGLVRLDISNESPVLVSGKTYEWSVALLSGTNHPLRQLLGQSAIERVEMTPFQREQLKLATTDRDRARIYAQNGFWYDALSTIATDYMSNPDDSDLLTDLTVLLNHIGLAQVLDQEY